MLPGLQPAHLEADQVRIEYRNSDTRESPTLAVDGVSLDVARNDLVCIVGPSGCGKTTFVNAVAGFIPIQGGVLRLDGDDIPGQARTGPWCSSSPACGRGAK